MLQVRLVYLVNKVRLDRQARLELADQRDLLASPALLVHREPPASLVQPVFQDPEEVLVIPDLVVPWVHQERAVPRE